MRDTVVDDVDAIGNEDGKGWVVTKSPGGIDDRRGDGSIDSGQLRSNGSTCGSSLRGATRGEVGGRFCDCGVLVGVGGHGLRDEARSGTIETDG